MTPRHPALALTLALAVAGWGHAADEKKPVLKPGSLLLIDSAGKEQLITGYRFSAGVRRLGWLAAEPPGAKGKGTKAAADGPEALVVRDDLTIHFLEGVVTLVPLGQLRSVRFDAEKSLMSARVAVGAGSDETLEGTTKFKGINKVTLEAEVDKGDAGVATLTYQGGVPRGGLRGIQFPAPRVEAARPGRPAVVISEDDDVKKAHKVSDLLGLYRLPSGAEKLLPTIMFRKSLKIDLGKVKTVRVTGDREADAVWQVVQKDGDDSTLSPLGTLPIGGQTATLVGIVGKVPAGFKLFPLRRVKAIHFDATEEPGEVEKDKDRPAKDGRN